MFAKRRQKLQDKRAALVKLSKELIAKAESEDRELTDEENSQLEANENDIKTLSTEIERLLRLEELEKQVAQPVPDRNVADPEADKEGEDKPNSLDASKKIVLPATAIQKPKHFAKPEDAFLSAQWFLAALYQVPGAIQWCKDHGVQLAASGVDGPKGGFLVPNVLENTIIDLREQYGVFRREAYNYPMSSESHTIPRRKSGLDAYFVGENEEATESEKGWGAVELVARKLMATTRFPTEYSEDAIIQVADDLAREIAYAFALKEDQCGFNGAGTSTYGGITGATVKINDGNHAASIVTAAAGNTSFDTLDLGDFESCVGKLPEYAEGNAKWYISKAGWAASMLRLLDAAGGNTSNELARGGGKTFLGYPVVITQVMNKTLTAQTSTIVALFGDLRMAATLGTRRGITIKSSEHRYIEKDQVLLTGTERFALNVHELGDGSDAGPLIALKTASG